MNNKLDDLFKMLFIKQCNKLHEILPELFEETEDYTEMLLNLSYTNEDDVIYMLINSNDGIPEEDFNVSSVDGNGVVTGQVEIIGWLYQYYNTELKDDTFAKLKKNIKITKERIPAATQLFTPDWIVRYMVENSVGRIWIEHLRALDSAVDEKATAEHFGWKYYLPEAEQEETVNVELAEIRKDYKDLQPTDIKCIDPCMGSGHILIAMFDVLMDIYKSVGYSERDAAFDIVENNIHGLDIDKRAYQLAYFAVMMKGRGYNRRFFRGRDDVKPVPSVYDFMESSEIDRKHLQFFGKSLSENERGIAFEAIEYLLNTFVNAKEFGSMLNVDECDWKLLEKFLNDLRVGGQYSIESIGSEETQEKLQRLVQIAKLLGQKYVVVVTNPPYMGSSGMEPSLQKHIRKNFVDGKTDLFAIFISRGLKLLLPYGYQSMVTMQSWMYLLTFSKLRDEILEKNVSNLIRIGYNSFPDMNSQVAHACAFVVRNSNIRSYFGKYFDLNTGYVTDDKDKVFIKKSADNDFYVRTNDDFRSIPGASFAFALSDRVIEAFATQPSLSDVGTTRLGMTTADNNRFTRFWYEVDSQKCIFDAKNEEDVLKNRKKWVPYNKGGKYRKWYGNLDVVVNWENSGYEIKNFTDDKGHIRSTVPNTEYYFRQCATWSKISTDTIAFRYRPIGSIFDVAGACLFSEHGLFELLAFCNSKVAVKILNKLSPTLNFEGSQIASLPIVKDIINNPELEKLSKDNVALVKCDWDSYETSWDFKRHPLIPSNLLNEKNAGYLSTYFQLWEKDCLDRY
ncbi:MAG: BREX-1 system adenine-specific DNA-methyltransferase PglX, partial [Lachnospiraceae bacterium]|nr:BREX-1 system adenine-specific DNA-methyltransferase PglX [Lachnospiraceae bacterium]